MSTGTQDGDIDSGYNNFDLAVREHMFDKELEPIDVGELNCLLIPRDAESYFPLEEKRTWIGLDFEDRTGKTWKFCYSYWKVSKKYVLTREWSLFVQEKELESGDTVSFYRGHVPDDNEPEERRNILFIDWSKDVN